MAASFAIIQEDEAGEVKVPRNATVQASDVPTHHVVGDYVDTSARLAQQGKSVRLWGHDLLNAYRQVPSSSGTILRTASGPTLWFHRAMCFGAAASVWNFNGAGDARW